MAARDSAAIAGGISEATLVDRAGGAVARGARHLLGGAYGRRVVVVCGKGNNGADGRIAGQRLADWGARVDRFDLAAFERPRFDRSLGRADLAVDAMFGTGFRGPLEGDAAFAADAPVRRALHRAGGRHPVRRRRPHRRRPGTGRRGRGHRLPGRPQARPRLLPRRSAGRGGRPRLADIGIDPCAPPPFPRGRRRGRRGRLVTSPGARESQVVSGGGLRGWGFAGDDGSSHAGRAAPPCGPGPASWSPASPVTPPGPGLGE